MKHLMIFEDFTNLYKRWKAGEDRKEDNKIREFIYTRKHPENYYVTDGDVVNTTNGESVVLTKDDLVDGKFPVKFGKIDGNFSCIKCSSTLISLEGAPNEVKGDFKCESCSHLTSLKGSPKIVGGNFLCSSCSNIISLEGAPDEVKGDFKCIHCNKLVSLKGSPKKVGGDFMCMDCIRLKSLEGAPNEVGEDFICNNCSILSSLEGTPIKIGASFHCNHTNITSLKGLHSQMSGYIDATYCDLLSSLKDAPITLNKYPMLYITFCKSITLNSIKELPKNINYQVYCNGCGEKIKSDSLPDYLKDKIQ